VSDRPAGARAEAASGWSPVESRPVVVRLAALDKQFGVVHAVQDVSFDIHAGEIFGILGPNGSGKTTTIRMLCGLMSPTAGRASVAGFDVSTQPEQVKLSIGYMSQSFGLYRDLTVEENLRFYGGLYGLDDRLGDRIAWALDRMKLEEIRGRLAGPMSGGQKQRLALACALLHRPPVLFLDEPTAGVDPGARRMFWTIIRGLADEGTTIIVTTHYMDEAEHFDRLAFMFKGRVIALGTPQAVRESFGDTMSLEDIFVQLQEQTT
jgi:ABC-2 type transport system ATP-binding protein